MSTSMVRKQIYIEKRQNILLKRLSKARGVSEAEIIRQAIEREICGGGGAPNTMGRSAWDEILKMVEQRKAGSSSGETYRWNRAEIYAERENRR